MQPGDQLQREVQANCTENGWTFEYNGQLAGPFSVLETKDPSFEVRVANQLRVQPPGKILAARFRNLQREINTLELNDILWSTVKRDETSKPILFLGNLLAQTESDQYNVALQSESGAGKSYLALELAEYFPPEEVRIYGGASPTSLFHQIGQWTFLQEVAKEEDLNGIFDKRELSDEKRRIIFVDLEGKILVFTDQPHWMLLERLRPLLSHDKKLLRYDITDKTGKGGLRTKTVLIKGFPTVIFATVKATQEDQERTRVWLLSPETSQEKISESLELLGAKIANREAFRDWINCHPQRDWLKQRVRLIRGTGIRNVVIPEWRQILEQFKGKRPRLAPRTTRDWSRLLCLVKGFALLNCFQRVRASETSIFADQKDVDAALELYEKVSAPNELGVSPEVYKIYYEVFLPVTENEPNHGVSRREIVQRHHELYGRPLGHKRLKEDIIPAWESVGLATVERNPIDKRETLVYCTIQGPVSPNGNNGSSDSAVHDTEQRRQAALDWLSEQRNADEDGWSSLDKLIQVAGDNRIVQSLITDGLTVLHPTLLNKIRLVNH